MTYSLVSTSLLAVTACSTGSDDRPEVDPEVTGAGTTAADSDELETTSGEPPTSTSGLESTGEEPATEGETDDTTGGETGADTDADTDPPGDTDVETGSTGELLPEAPEDGDNPAEPALYVQFRATSPAPLSFDAPLFNDEPIDTQGAQYIEQLSVRGDDMDVIDFRIVPGEVDPTIRIQLECDAPEQNRVRARLYDDDGTAVDTIVCGEGEVSVLLVEANSADDYQLQVELLDGDPLLTSYTLSINGFCFQQCNFTPYDG